MFPQPVYGVSDVSRRGTDARAVKYSGWDLHLVSVARVLKYTCCLFTCMHGTLSPKKSARSFMVRVRERWHALLSHQASSDSATSCSGMVKCQCVQTEFGKTPKKLALTAAVHLCPVSMMRLQNMSQALSIPPEHTMKSLWVRTSLLYPRRYAW